MTTPTVFSSDKSVVPVVDTSKTPGDTGAASKLAILVGEGRKYKTPDDLANAYLEADGFMERLKAENVALREQGKASKTIDDVLQRLEQQKASTQDKGADKAQQGLTADSIAKIVRETVTGLETEKSSNANLQRADAALKKLYGDKAGEVFAKEANTPEKKAALTQLASIDPDKFVKLFSPGTQDAGTRTDAGGTVNTAALDQTNNSARAADAGCKEFYSVLRKTKPSEYYSQAVQLKMNRAAVADPDKFFGKSS